MEGTVNCAVLVKSVGKRVLEFWSSPRVPRNPVAPVKLAFPYISGPQWVLSRSCVASCSTDRPHFLPDPLVEARFPPLSTGYATYRALCSFVFDCFALTSMYQLWKERELCCQADLGLHHRLAVYLLCHLGRTLEVSDPLISLCQRRLRIPTSQSLCEN